MAKPKVYSTHQLFEEGRKILDAECEVQYWTDSERPPRDEVPVSYTHLTLPTICSV